MENSVMIVSVRDRKITGNTSGPTRYYKSRTNLEAVEKKDGHKSNFIRQNFWLDENYDAPFIQPDIQVRNSFVI